jgi:DNA-binding transcriptional LysR family regulator
MSSSTSEIEDLLRWLKNPDRWGGLSRVTVGQLIILLELYGSPSVAAAASANPSRGHPRAPDTASLEVNYRQKLRRLSEGLGVKVLATRDGGRSCLSAKGEALAQELRVLLGEVRGTRAADSMCLHIAAGDSWLQSVVLPVLLDNREHWERVTWRVSNLSARDVIRGLKDGGIHFGLVRRSDLPPRDQDLSVHPRCEWPIASFSVLVGANGPKKPRVRDAASVMSALRGSVLVLYGSPTGHVAKHWDSMARNVVGTRPLIECDTHLQAALAVQGRDAWCVVPSHVASLVRCLGAEREGEADSGGWSYPLDSATRGADDASDALCLVKRDRELDRIPGARKVLNKLGLELAKKFRA